LTQLYYLPFALRIDISIVRSFFVIRPIALLYLRRRDGGERVRRLNLHDPLTAAGGDLHERGRREIEHDSFGDHLGLERFSREIRRRVAGDRLQPIAALTEGSLVEGAGRFDEVRAHGNPGVASLALRHDPVDKAIVVGILPVPDQRPRPGGLRGCGRRSTGGRRSGSGARGQGRLVSLRRGWRLVV